MTTRPFILAVLILRSLAAAAETYPAAARAPESLAAWRAQRLERLTSPTGWLSLIGLHFLPAGESTVGRAPGNRVVLAAGPAHVGTVALGEDGTVTFNPADATVQVDGKSVPAPVLAPEVAGRPGTLVSTGTVSFFVVERGGRKALRVRDTASPRRTGFAGIDAFPESAAWRIEARWEPFSPPQGITLTNVLGQSLPAEVPGRAVFDHDGRTHALLAIDEGPDEPLFFILADATSGHETYAGARFLYADRPPDGRVVLDFNRAINPPCAFTPFATCPLPPRENRLPFAVTAGEKTYPGRPD